MVLKVIPSGVNRKVFRRADHTEARHDLGLPHGATILFVTNGSPKNTWKNYRTLQPVLVEILKTGTKVLCLLLSDINSPEQIGNVKIRFIPCQ